MVGRDSREHPERLQALKETDADHPSSGLNAAANWYAGFSSQ